MEPKDKPGKPHPYIPTFTPPSGAQDMTLKKLQADANHAREKTFLLTPTNADNESSWLFVSRGDPGSALTGLDIEFSDEAHCDVTIKVQLQGENWVFLSPAQVSGGTWQDIGNGWVQKTSTAGLTIKTPQAMQDDTGSESNSGILVDSARRNVSSLPSSVAVDANTISLTFAASADHGDSTLEKVHFKFVAYQSDGDNTYSGYVSADPLFEARWITNAALA